MLKKPTKKQLGKYLDREKLPIVYRSIQQVDKALSLYCRDLLLQCKTTDQASYILQQAYSDAVYIEALVTEERDKLNVNKKELFEELVKRGLGLALEQNNLKAYITGLNLLKDLYGVHRSYLATIKETRPQFMSTAFLDLKETEDAVEAELVEQPVKE